MVIMSMILFILELNFPFLTICIIWFICNKILAGLDLVIDNIKSISSKPIFKSFGADIILESLVMEASPFICDDVFVEAFKK